MSSLDTTSSKTAKSSATTGTKTEKPKLTQRDLFSVPITEYVPPQLKTPIVPEKPIIEAKFAEKSPIQPLKSLKSGNITQKQVLKVIAGGIAVLSAFQSCYYSFSWFSALLPTPFAVIMALIIVASSVLLPEFAIMLFKRFWLAGICIALIGLLAMSFSMMSTIAGLYNARTQAVKTESVVNAENDTNLRLLESAKVERIRLEKEIDRLNREIDANLAKSSSPFSTKQQVNTADYYVQKGKKDRVDYEAKLSKISIELSRLDSIVIVTKVDRQDFYSFIAGLFGWNADALEFSFAAFPSLFLDIIAPVMLGVALFL